MANTESSEANVTICARFSFGSGVSSVVAPELTGLKSLTLVAPPVEKYDFQIQNTRFACPLLIVQGTADDLVDYATVKEWAVGVTPKPEILMLKEADHFFHGRLVELRERVVEVWSSRLTG
jgi:alpha/beta superfamily hydrolase